MPEQVLYEIVDNIAWIKLNRPQSLNAITESLIPEYVSVLKEIRKNQQVRVAILKGEGSAFCAGADIKERQGEIFASKTIHDRREHWIDDADMTIGVRNLGKPLIAAIHGYCLGAGMEFAMACDFRIAAEGAKFGYPEANIGAAITCGSLKLLPQLIGISRAKEMVFTSRMFDSEEALQFGLVNKVVPQIELDKEATHLAKQIAKNNPEMIRLMRSIMDFSSEASLDAVLQFETMVAEEAQLSGSTVAGFKTKAQTIKQNAPK